MTDANKNAALVASEAASIGNVVADAFDSTGSDVPTSSSPNDATLQFTLITSANPPRLTKTIGLRDGKLTKTAAASMTRGRATRGCANSLHDLSRILDAVTVAQAIAWGVTPTDAAICTDKQARKRSDGTIARTRDHFTFASGPGVLMLDHDGVPTGSLTGEEFRARLVAACPALGAAPMLYRPSVSSGICTAEGRELTGHTKHRLYIPVADASAIPEAGKRLVSRLWANGFGWYDVSKSGALLERCIVDASVWQPERLDFVAPPDLRDGLTRMAAPSKVYGDSSGRFDLAAITLDTGTEKRAKEKKKATREQVRPEADGKRETYITEQAPRLASERSITLDQARDVLRRATEKQVLTGDFMLTASDGARVSVGTILDNADRWHNARFADPFGDYPSDLRIAWANLKSGTRPALRSHGHGGQRWELRRQSARIQVAKGMRVVSTDATLDVLRARGELFEFGEGAIAYVAEGRARAVGRDWLTDYMGRACEYFSIKMPPEGSDKPPEERPEDAPVPIAAAIIAKTGERGFRKLTAVVTAPTLRTDGSLLDGPGYDEASGLLYYSDGARVPSIPDAPTPTDALDALRFLWEPVAQFPYQDDVARAVTMQALITATLRASLPTAPGTGADAPSAGTGKTLLMKCIAMLANGTEPAVLPPTDDENEIRKRLFAALRDGDRVLLWDNVRGLLGCAALDAFLTADTFKDRVLGLSETAALPNRALFLATGNNLRATGDTCRRILIARLDAHTERAYTREFSFDPVQRIRADRTRYVMAALCIVRAYIAAGRPKMAKGRTASFELWDDLVRQPVCWLAALVEAAADRAGLPTLTDPLRATETAFEQDPETGKLAALLHAWRAEFQTDGKSVAQAIHFAEQARGPLLDAIEEIAMQGRDVNRRMLGRWIEAHAGQILDGLRFERDARRTREGTLIWKVQQRQ